MMLDFYGLELTNRRTGQLRRRERKFESRYSEAIARSWHNHLRLTRIMVCLNATGFSLYANSLSRFLEQEAFEGERPPLAELQDAESWDFWRAQRSRDENGLPFSRANDSMRIRKLEREVHLPYGRILEPSIYLR